MDDFSTRLKQDQDRIIALGLFIVTLASRIPLRSHILYSWDSGSFALALDRFSIASDQPQAPGYILYVALGRLSHLLFSDANDALVALSILGGALAVSGIYLFGRSLFDRRTGLIAATLLFFSPLAWFYSEIALTYGVELPLVMAVSWFLYKLFFERRYVITTAILIGVAAGFRQDVLMFLGPFWLIGSIRIGGRAMLLSWLAMALTTLAWFIPLVDSAGGLISYRTIVGIQFDLDVYPVSVFVMGLSALAENLRDLFRGFIGLFGLSIFAFLYIALLLAFGRRFRADRRVLFLLALPLPALIFFALFSFDPPGYLLVFATTLVVLVARAISVLADNFGRIWVTLSERKVTTADDPARFPAIVFLIAIMIMIVGINVTFLNTEAVCVDIRFPFTGRTVSTCKSHHSLKDIRDSDRETPAISDAVRHFDPDTTLVVSDIPFVSYGDNWRRLMYYLPDYRTIMIRTVDEGGGYHDGGNRRAVYVPDDKVIHANAQIRRVLFVGVDPAKVRAAVTPVPVDTPVVKLYSADFPAGGTLWVDGYQFVH